MNKQTHISIHWSSILYNTFLQQFDKTQKNLLSAVILCDHSSGIIKWYHLKYCNNSHQKEKKKVLQQFCSTWSRNKIGKQPRREGKLDDTEKKKGVKQNEKKNLH